MAAKSKRPRRAKPAPAPAAPRAIGRRRKARRHPWTRRIEIGHCTLYEGDCVAVMAALEAESVHSVVTDPPYELGFMGKAWDKAGGVASRAETWAQALAALKPGGQLVAFAGSRTYHRIACAIEDAGFDIRDQLMWIYGSGFPKSHDIAKCIDKRGGVHRGKAGSRLVDRAGKFLAGYQRSPKGEAVFDDARTWDGWGTALKPAHEPIALGRKPFRGTVTDNVLAHHTGALHIDAARVDWQSSADAAAAAAAQRTCHDSPGRQRWDGARGMYMDPAGSLATWEGKADLGRWPANILHDGSIEVIGAFPAGTAREATRFFYSPKAGRDEREFGMDGAPKTATHGDGIGASPKVKGQRPTKAGNIHPTVKPVDLMRWLCRLITPPGGIVLEPFMGSGSTGIAAVREGLRFIGIEQSSDYFDIARRRIEAAVAEQHIQPDLVHKIQHTPARQLELI